MKRHLGLLRHEQVAVYDRVQPGWSGRPVPQRHFIGQPIATDTANRVRMPLIQVPSTQWSWGGASDSFRVKPVMIE